MENELGRRNFQSIDKPEIFSDRTQLGGIIGAAGIMPGTDAYEEAVGWISLEMQRTFRITSPEDLAFQVDPSRANTLYSGLKQHLEILRETGVISTEEQVFTEGFLPEAITSESGRKQDSSHPWIQKGRAASRMQDQQDTAVSLLPVVGIDRQIESESELYTLTDILTVAGTGKEFKGRLKVKRILQELGISSVENDVQDSEKPPIQYYKISQNQLELLRNILGMK